MWYGGTCEACVSENKRSSVRPLSAVAALLDLRAVEGVNTAAGLDPGKDITL